jgi:hypothetical protein
VIYLRRVFYTLNETFGILRCPNGRMLSTVELPWRGNARGVSCIPPGTYQVRLGSYKGRYPDLEVQDVPERDAIEIHAANLASELRGCIAVGKGFGYVKGERGVVHSRDALALLLSSMDGEEDTLIIEEFRYGQEEDRRVSPGRCGRPDGGRGLPGSR